MASAAMTKTICPCCGKQEGVPLVHDNALDAEALWQARRGELACTMHSRLPAGFDVILNQQCLRCEFAWRIIDNPSRAMQSRTL